MKRLTKRDEFGNADIIGVNSMDLQCNLAFNEFDKVTNALNKLAEYEDIGLLPEQIIEVDRLYAEKCKELAELQKNSEWIPCSERLPEACKNVLVWYEYFRYGDYNRMFQTYGIGFQVKGQWCGDVNGVDARCIAWQPLPEAYHQLSEENI